jgi:leukotriene-A4 hydrolase
LNLKSKHLSQYRIIGEVKIQFKAINDVDKIILDTKGISIKSVTDNNWENIPFILDESQKIEALGIPLVITPKIQLKKDNSITIIIQYITSENSESIHWLDAEYTLGKKHPYMYTQGYAILTRTILPCQDTPEVKARVKGRITVPNPLVGLIAGIRTHLEYNTDTTTYHYELPVPIPTYLIAAAAGKLENRKLSERSSVWGEREIVDKARYEFEETEDFIKIVFIFNFRW